MINVTLPDGSVRQCENGTTSLDVAKSISEGLARNVLAAKVDGQVIDATRPLNNDCTLQLLTWNDTEGKSTMWHSSAHLMAEALEFYFPGIKLAIGPPIANGFYYDVDFMEHSISEKDLEKVEQKMKELAKEKNPYIRKEVSKADALAYFTDLCRGQHIPDTSFIKTVKLTSITSAYWKGDENNKQLTLIYGIN